MEYSIFDSNPNESSGGGEWPDTNSGPDAEDYEDAERLAFDALDWAVEEVDGNRDYSVGDTIWVLVYCDDGTVLQDSRTLELGDFSASDSDITSSEWEATRWHYHGQL